jgi:hypothetical protein
VVVEMTEEVEEVAQTVEAEAAERMVAVAAAAEMTVAIMPSTSMGVSRTGRRKATSPLQIETRAPAGVAAAASQKRSLEDDSSRRMVSWHGA